MDLNDLLSSLSAEDMESLRATAAQFLGGGEGKASASVSSGLPDMSAIDPKLLQSISRVAGVMKERDARCDLIAALKPLLKESRRAKADEAMTILRLTKLLDGKEGGLL